MHVYRGLPSAAARTPCALTIGNFDGVHRGHQALLAHLRAAADDLGIAAAVMTFEPHPREFFAKKAHDPTRAPARIASLRDKLGALAAAGVDRVIVEHFGSRFAALTARQFIEEILVKGCHARWIMVGEDFCFGAGRSGNVNLLRSAGEEFGFTVKTLATVTEDGERVSSSLVRKALAEGNLERARQLLGRPYFMSGHVVHGAKLGRKLGFPTLNLRIAHPRPALSGIFVVQVHGLDGPPVPGVASIGLRPTVDQSGRVLLEVHLFDFASNVYGKLVSVEFLKKLRDEEKYPDLAALTAAISEDTRQARAFFGLPPLSLNFATSATDRIS
ncbi:MAG: bifunctional riboflavin kinase/FAD synthetase [Burkholderiaceae bacterium]|jgi:riboflavin kinase/FMN adenylyltransferase